MNATISHRERNLLRLGAVAVLLALFGACSEQLLTDPPTQSSGTECVWVNNQRFCN